MGFFSKLWNRLTGNAKHRAVEAVCAEDAWDEPTASESGTGSQTGSGGQTGSGSIARTPNEAFFQADYEQSLPTHRNVERVLKSKKGVAEVLADAKKMTELKLIVGLGNPGSKYVGTRHNIGYAVLAELGKRHGVGRPKTKFQGEILEASFYGKSAILLSPTTYMNLSGQSVRPCFDFYKVDLANVLVICDDINLPCGTLRLRAGGKKGLKDILRVMGTEAVPRLRVGIGKQPANMDLADYVLSHFSKSEDELIQVAIQEAADAVELWVKSGIEACMDRYNADGKKADGKKADGGKKPTSKKADGRNADGKTADGRKADGEKTDDKQPV